MKKNKRYRLNYTHEYNGEKVFYSLMLSNGTYNMIPKLEDIITDYEGNGRFLNNTRPKLDSTISFFSMNSDLKRIRTR